MNASFTGIEHLTDRIACRISECFGFVNTLSLSVERER